MTLNVIENELNSEDNFKKHAQSYYTVVQLKMSLVMRKPAFCICENKDADQLISAFVFATRIVQSLFYLNPKFQASSHLLWLYRPVCVGPGRKPRRPVFSQRGSNYTVSKIMVSNVRLCNLCIQELPMHSRIASINIGMGIQINLKQNATRLELPGW